MRANLALLIAARITPKKVLPTPGTPRSSRLPELTRRFWSLSYVVGISDRSTTFARVFSVSYPISALPASVTIASCSSIASWSSGWIAVVMDAGTPVTAGQGRGGPRRVQWVAASPRWKREDRFGQQHTPDWQPHLFRVLQHPRACVLHTSGSGGLMNRTVYVAVAAALACACGGANGSGSGASGSSAQPRAATDQSATRTQSDTSGGATSNGPGATGNGSRASGQLVTVTG